MNSRLANNRGFTLIELLISIFILVFISIAVYQITVKTFDLREKLSVESDFYTSVRLSMGIVERDIALLYTPMMIVPAPPQNPGTQPGTPPAPGAPGAEIFTPQERPSTFWNSELDKTGIRPSHFLGSDTKLTFVSASHLRMYRESPESDFAKITYELQAEKDAEGMVLVKTASPNAFDDDDAKDTMRHVYPLLHGVTKLKYRFYRKDKDRWETSWDNDHPDYKNLYPDMVEINLEVKGASRMHFEGIYKFRPEMPIHGLDVTI